MNQLDGVKQKPRKLRSQSQSSLILRKMTKQGLKVALISLMPLEQLRSQLLSLEIKKLMFEIDLFRNQRQLKTRRLPKQNPKHGQLKEESQKLSLKVKGTQRSKTLLIFDQVKLNLQKKSRSIA